MKWHFNMCMDAFNGRITVSVASNAGTEISSTCFFFERERDKEIETKRGKNYVAAMAKQCLKAKC